MRIAYIDTFAGISGDMTLAALLDAGLDLDTLRAELNKLPVTGWTLDARKVMKGAISATQVTVSLTDQAQTGHGHGHDQHGRTCAELVSWVEQSSLDAEVKQAATAILWSLAVAEGKVHEQPPEEVHFHELAGIDTIIDVVGAVVGFRLLSVERIYCAPVPVSHGQIQTAHGLLPVPPPAVMELLQGLPTRPLDIAGETVTPTGAALVRGLAASFGPMPAMTLESLGYGAGRAEWPSVPNVLRLCIGERHEGAMPGAERGSGRWAHEIAEQIMMAQTNLDDMNPELLPAVLDACLSAGAIDAWLAPIQMKKGRPAVMLTALAQAGALDAVVLAILEHSTSLGVRVSPWERRCLPREFAQVQTPYGQVTVKIGRLGDRTVTVSPEFEDCRRLAQAAGVAVKHVYAAAVAAAQKL